MVRLSLSPDETYQGAPPVTRALAEARPPLPGGLGGGLGCLSPRSPSEGESRQPPWAARRLQVTELPLRTSPVGTQPEKQKPRAGDSW